MVRIAAELGMTPILPHPHPGRPKPPEDPFEAFLQNRG